MKDISDFKRLDKNLVYEMDKVLTHDIPKLLQKVINIFASKLCQVTVLLMFL